jgi:hypothetical protein
MALMVNEGSSARPKDKNAYTPPINDNTIKNKVIARSLTAKVDKLKLMV